jgi:hypothetical protein
LLCKLHLERPLRACELGVSIVFIEKKWFWGEMVGLDSTLYIYGVILRFGFFFFFFFDKRDSPFLLTMFSLVSLVVFVVDQFLWLSWRSRVR